MSESSAIAQRNLMRTGIQAVADGLEGGDLSTIEAADKLRQICAEDIIDLDKDDIDIDFDAGAQLATAMATGAGASGKEDPGNPVEIALSRAVAQRDRLNGLTIVGDTPGAQDRADYLSALADLKTALETCGEI